MPQYNLLPLLHAQLTRLIQKGPSAWGITTDKVELVPAQCNGKNGSAMFDEAVACKRAGRYGDAIAIFFQLLTESEHVLGFVSLAIMRGLCKLLICLNEYYLAWGIVCTIMADIEQHPNPDLKYQTLFMQDFKVLMGISREVVDDGNFSTLRLLTSETSGSYNYRFVKSDSQILSEFKIIRSEVRNNYGV